MNRLQVLLERGLVVSQSSPGAQFFRQLLCRFTHNVPARKRPHRLQAAVDKKRARLNCIDHLLHQFPYVEVLKEPITLPEREHHEHYSRQAVPADMLVPEVY